MERNYLRTDALCVSFGKKKKDKQRYNLHYKVRKQGYRLNAKERTVFVHYKIEKYSKQVEKLQNKFNYAIQYEL